MVTLCIVNRQGGIDERSVTSVDETINSGDNIAKIRAGGRCAGRELGLEYNTPNIGR
ncbi:hypothetical protein BDW02DRAFT_564693 [Decorospora gaudefroyi]|uniref:Uncharacterized protein n=1 Tax=Decorospora gaudefroyi TaxID=184978 RepID=A0A6A5KW28_9PLEO|nr:hypothetical protein BDW02DRAFT_566824 [Decorospora gaudefroyi]KAF1838844.1 hypothetical protein BDW02DRAFT_564693 [Decorospora gaudefroyi]